MPFGERGFAGIIAIKPTGGSTFYLPAQMGRPRNPKNNSYLPCINMTSFPSIKVPGRKTPTIQIATYLKSSWAFNATDASIFFNAAMMNLATDGNGDLCTKEYAIGLYEPTAAAWRVWDGCKLMLLGLSQDAIGGPLSVEMAFRAIYGESEKTGGATSFSLPSNPDGGNVTDVSQVVFKDGSSVVTADQVKSWRLSKVRGQLAQDSINGTLYADAITSGQYSGVLTLEQGRLASVVPTTSCAWKIGVSGSGFMISTLLSLDEMITDMSPGFLNQANTWSLFDTSNVGGSPCIITHLP